MAFNTTDTNTRDEVKEQNERLRRILYRIIPYTPLIALAILSGIFATRVYLRYATRLYAAKARLIVNDDSQKDANLVDIVQFDTRDMSAETEKEMEILQSRDLLSKLVSTLQLNVVYGQKGYFKTGQYFNDIPVTLELQYPDSVKSFATSEVELVGDRLRFNGILYPLDSFVTSKWGNIRWHLNKEYKPEISHKNNWFVTIQPVAAAVGTVKGSLSAKPISKLSSILELTYTDEIPERGVVILNNLITLYGTSGVDYKSRISINTLNFLDTRLQLIAQELGGKEKELQTFKSKQGITDLGAEGTLFLGQLSETDKKTGELQVQMEVLDEVEKYVTQRNNTNNEIPATLGTTDPILSGLLTQLYQTEFELEKTRQVSGSKNPQIEVLENAIAKLKPSILTSIKNLKLNIVASLQQLKEDNNKFSAQLNKIPRKERLLLDISRQQSIKNAIYTFLLQKKEESAISAAAILPNYRVIERPEQAGMVAPIANKIYIYYTFLALLLAAVFIYLREFANSRILFRAQIEDKLPVPIIAELSYQPNKTGGPIVVGTGIRNLIGEQFRELRTNLSYVTAATKEKCKVILVTSSVSGEGKSFVAINTSISLSLTGAKVALLEFDLRKPKISKELGLSRDPGLSNYLIDKATVKDIIKPHPSIANFFIISSGPIPPNPAELISSEKLPELITELKQQFDYIIIDSPPIAAVTDAKILAGVANATLYLIRHSFTDVSMLKMISDVQHKEILPHLNIIFNSISPKKILGYNYGKGYGYGYGTGYGYGSGYGEESKKKKK